MSKKTTKQTAKKGLGVNGNLNPGGTVGNKGGGRPPDWLKEKCRGLIEKNGLIERLTSIAKGEDVDVRTSVDGEGEYKVPAPMAAQVKATEILLDRGYGKVPQALEHSGEVGGGRMVLIFPEPSK